MRGWYKHSASTFRYLVMSTYGAGVALAALAGVLASPVVQVSPLMGSSLVIVVFAVVVIGGMGSIVGAIISGLVLGLIEGLTKVVYPGSIEYRGIRHHGGGIDLAPRRICSAGNDAMKVAHRNVSRHCDCGARRAVPRALSGLSDEAAVLSDVRMRVQSSARLHQDALVRACRLFRVVGIRHGMADDGSRMGDHRVDPGRRRRGHGAGVGHWGDRSAPPRHLFCDDHPGSVAAGVFRVSAGPLHRRRERPSGHTAGQPLRHVGLGSDRTMYYFVLAIFAAVFAFIRRIVHSPFGQVLKAIRANEPRAVSLGYKVDRYKLLAFVLSASLAGLAGSLKALVLGFVTLSDVSQETSGEVILMTLLGGSGTFLGPVVGANLVVTLQEYLSDWVGAWVSVIIGAIFVVCVMIFRRGFVGEIQGRLARLAGSSPPPPDQSAT